MAWSSDAWACGTGAMGAVGATALMHVLLMVFGISLIGVLSLRAAGGAFRRMRAVQAGVGLQVGHGLVTMGYAISIATTIVSGGILLALVLVS